MNDDERKFEDFVSNIKFDDAPDHNHRDKLEYDLLGALAKQKSRQIKIWRIIMKSRITKLTAAAVIIIVLMLGINYLGTPIDGASTVFAAAMDSMRQARTFSCTGIFQGTYQNGEERGKYLMKQTWMFKEPDRKRHVMLTSPWPKYRGEITITDFGKRQQLILRPYDMTGKLVNMSSDYVVDANTGKLKLKQLDTSLRDRLLKLSAGAVEDLGSVELEGKSVRMLQSRRDNRITTVWIDPQTNFPVQIEIKWTNQSRSPVMYTSIQIDTELDDALFSLEPPEGYTVRVQESGWPEGKKKIFAKMRHINLACIRYANQHDNQFPSELSGLLSEGIITDEVLKVVLAAPNEPDGPPVIKYRQPDTDADWSTEVMLYEPYDRGLVDGRVVVIMLDGHGELIPVQTLVQLLKPWPEYKKKLSLKMTHLHWLCDQYAKEHEGRYPGELKDLIGEKFSDEIIKRLQAAPDQPGGPAVIRYRPPRANADPSTEVILFEIFDQWPDDSAVVCYADGHCEIIPDQNSFEELIR